MLRSVILRGARVLRDRHNHFVRGRSDRQLAFVLGDCVVVCVEVFARRVGDRVRYFTFGNIRHAARRLDIRHFTGNKAVARYRHVRLRQRRAVVGFAGRFRGQRHRALLDHELAVRRLRNDIFFCRVNLANRTFRKGCRIGFSIRSRRARCGKAFKGNAFRRTGKAGNALLRSIISLRLAVRRQLDVLIIVEIDYVIGRVSLNCDRLRLIRYRRVAIGPDGGFRRLFPERLACNGLGRLDRIFSPVPVVIHRIAQVGLLRVVEDDFVLSLISDRDRLRGFRYQFIAVNIRCFLCHRLVKRLILHGLYIEKILVRALLKVFHRVAQIVFSGVYNINRQVFVGHLAANNRFIRLIADDRRRSYAVGFSRLYLILRIRILCFQIRFRNQV